MHEAIKKQVQMITDDQAGDEYTRDVESWAVETALSLDTMQSVTVKQLFPCL